MAVGEQGIIRGLRAFHTEHRHPGILAEEGVGLKPVPWVPGLLWGSLLQQLLCCPDQYTVWSITVTIPTLKPHVYEGSKKCARSTRSQVLWRQAIVSCH